MLTRIAGLFLVCSVAVGVLGAQNAPSIKKVSLSMTSPVSGEEMFTTYCAVCHGKDGKGAGPAAAALKKAPTNLTSLAALNNGKFPEYRVDQTISGDTQVVAHGSVDMPVWGELFRSMSPGKLDIVRLRIVNLTEYIKSIQTK